MLKWLAVASLLLVALVVVYFVYLSWATRQHPVREAADRVIRPCPDKPNCVSSQDPRPGHAIAPLPLTNDRHDSDWKRLADAIRAAGGDILVDDGSYLHAVFTSTLFRFRDDLEAMIQENRIEMRSASRAGTSDLGVNRKRIEALRAAYLEQAD